MRRAHLVRVRGGARGRRGARSCAASATAGRAGGGQRRAPGEPDERPGGELSPREWEVATLVAAGKRNREVAAALFLREKPVESHLARIYDKLGVHSRAALATVIARTTSPPPSRCDQDRRRADGRGTGGS